MGLFDRSKTVQESTQYVDTTEIGIGEVGDYSFGYVGGSVVDPGSYDLAAELFGVSSDAVVSLASQALSSQQQTQYDALKANGDFATASLLAIGASNEQANRLAENALFRVAESVNPDALAPSVLDQTTIRAGFKYLVAALAIGFAGYYFVKGR